MAAPAIQTADTQTGQQAASSANWTATYPTNLVAGDLILLIGQASSSTAQLTGMTGWVVHVSTAFGMFYAKKAATGSETGNFTIPFGAAATGEWLVYRITGWDRNIGSVFGVTPQMSAGSVDATTQGNNAANPDPPALNPASWDTEDTLYITAIGTTSVLTVSGFPSGYTNTYTHSSNSATLAVASKSTTGVASEDPGAFTAPGAAGAETWTQAVFAVRSPFGPTIMHGDVQHGVQTSNSTSWTLTYPTNLQSGDLLILFQGKDGSGTTFTLPAGWVSMGLNGSSGANALNVAGKVSDGTETGNFTLTTDSEQGGWRILRITDWYGGAVPDFAVSPDTIGISFGVGGVGATQSPNPVALNPANWDAENTLWICAAAVDTSRTFSAWPTNYMPGTSSWDDVSGGSTGASLSVQYRRLNAASEDPGTFTISAADDWVCATVAVRPTAAAAALILEQGYVDFADPGVL